MEFDNMIDRVRCRLDLSSIAIYKKKITLDNVQIN